MKLGVLTVPFASKPLEEFIPYLHSLGVQAVELGTGGVTNKAHCDPAVYLHNPEKIRALKQLLADNDMVISALGSVKSYAQNRFWSLVEIYYRGRLNRPLVTFQQAGRKGSRAAVRRLSCP